MSRQLTPQSSLETLKKEAKRWLKALRENDPDARARLARALSDPPADPGLRDVQHALAREHGLPGWTALKEELARRRAADVPASRDAAIQALLAAAERGDARRVGAVLDAFPDIVNERNAENRTALHLATNPMSEATIEVLLARGADPNLRDDGDNAMPLHFAAERGHLGIVRRLIEHGADPIGAGDLHQLEVIGWATAFEAATHTEVAEYLLAHGARQTIDSAVALGDTSAIRDVAARAPADLDRPMDQTNHRRRPLHLAILKEQPASLDTLLSLGADVEAEDAAGLTPLEQAALSGQRAMARRLLEHDARVRLPTAIALEMPGEVERLLRAEPDSLRPGGRWDKLILRASERGSAPIVEALLRAGASVHARDDHRTAVDQTHGYTPLHAAAFRGNADVVRVLLRHGANPADREDKYWGTPAGWADYAGHTEVRDLILEGPIDLFDAISFDRTGRIDEILARDPLALHRPFGDSVNGDRKARPWLDPAWTPVAFAVAHGKLDAVRLLAERGADCTVRDSDGRTLIELASARGQTDIATFLAERSTAPPPRPRAGTSAGERIADFLQMACLDWRTGGSERLRRREDAGRLLERHPEIARANLYTAVVCGEVEVVRRLLGQRPAAASEPGGPRLWPPLLYLCAARLPGPAASERAVEIARLLLDHGADPNAFYLGGNADIYYTALTCVLGCGEEQALPHPDAHRLARLLLERGANPHDTQVLYNVFADHASRRLLDDDIVWLLESIYEHSLRRGHEADWKNPEWPMLAMRGAPSLGDGERVHPGSHFLLEAAIDRNLLGMAEWLLAHGAGPDVPAGNLWRRPARTLHQEAVVRGHTEMARLLERYGATPTPLPQEGPDAFVAACLAMDRERVAAMLAQRPGLLRDPHALFAAVARDRADAVAMLLDLGVSPDLEDPGNGRRRALHVAAWAGAERAAAVLIERGADVDARETHHNANPLGVAAWAQQPGMVTLLGRHSRSVPELTYTGQVERLREVLREDPTRARSSGEAALQWLPSDPESALEIATLLLDHGVDPGGRNARGETAADLAERRGLEAVVALLRSREG